MKTADEQGFPDEAEAGWRDSEESRRRQLREDARRTLAENLAEGLASASSSPPSRAPRGHRESTAALGAPNSFAAIWTIVAK